MADLVSIVIPVYNAEPYLEECLQSVQQQTYPFIEVILINDGSTDQSEELIKKFTARDARFKSFRQENRGLGFTRNRGISLSAGKYVFFLDADDKIPPKAVETLVSAIEKYDADYAVGKVLRFSPERIFVPLRLIEFNLYDKNKITNVNQSPQLIQDSIACNKLWKKEFLLKHQLAFTEGKLYEDLAFTLKAAVLAKKIAVVQDTVYYWRVRGEKNKPSITQRQMDLKNTLDRVEALTRNREWLKTAVVSERIVEENDLKSLLDIIRLHVIKYALVKESEREEWKEGILSFVQKIPQKIANRLPIIEKNLYQLLIDQNFHDLELFSQMYTNSETNPIVEQRGSSFFLRGKGKDYDVTYDLKPIVKAEKIQRKNLKWEISGRLILPKCSYETKGHFYLLGRKSKVKIILEETVLEKAEENDIYPHERHKFQIVFDPKLLLKYKKESTFDFYYRLSGDEKKNRPSRFQLHPSAKEKYTHYFAFFTKVVLYRTNNGNLSVKVERLYFLRDMLGSILKKIKKKGNF